MKKDTRNDFEKQCTTEASYENCVGIGSIDYPASQCNNVGNCEKFFKVFMELSVLKSAQKKMLEEVGGSIQIGIIR